MIKIFKTNFFIIFSFLLWVLTDFLFFHIDFRFLLVFFPWFLFNLKFYQVARFAIFPIINFLILILNPEIKGLELTTYFLVVFTYYISISHQNKSKNENISSKKLSNNKVFLINTFTPWIFIIRLLIFLIFLYVLEVFKDIYIIFIASIHVFSFSFADKLASPIKTVFFQSLIALLLIDILTFGFIISIKLSYTSFILGFGVILAVLVFLFGFYDFEPLKTKKR